MSKPMRVQVVVTIDLPEPEQWTTFSGIEGERQIRADVKSYVGDGLQYMGVFGNGEVRADISWR